MKQPIVDERNSGAHLALTPERLIKASNPAVARLASVVEKRDNVDSVLNYSRLHHRHSRSHTRK
jgi:hypothetical protein